jgi:hypothetical protein
MNPSDPVCVWHGGRALPAVDLDDAICVVREAGSGVDRVGLHEGKGRLQGKEVREHIIKP